VSNDSLFWLPSHCFLTTQHTKMRSSYFSSNFQWESLSSKMSIIIRFRKTFCGLVDAKDRWRESNHNYFDILQRIESNIQLSLIWMYLKRNGSKRLRTWKRGIEPFKKQLKNRKSTQSPISWMCVCGWGREAFGFLSSLAPVLLLSLFSLSHFHFTLDPLTILSLLKFSATSHMNLDCFK
jgi:hypothetical protein